MGKSLTETAKAVLMKEGMVPSVSPMDAGHPDRDAKNITPNKATLRPGSGYSDAKPIVNPGSTPPTGEEEDLGGQTPTSGAPTENLGAKAAGKTGKDTSKSSQSNAPVKAEAPSHLEEDIEISEELEQFIATLAEQGFSDDEIAQAIEENFEIVEESEEEDEEEESGKKKKMMKEKKEEEEEEDEEEEESDEDKKEKKEEKDEKKDMKEHVDALLAGENLSEEFRAKAETIFESAVKVRVNEEVSVLEEAYVKSLEEEVDKIKAELTEQVDNYLNYVVEQWVKDNEVAIETGLRTELTEDFITGLKNLFAEHYIDIPEDKVSVIDELGSKVEELETKLNEEIDRNVSLSKQINESKQNEILISACEDLTTTQSEKLKSLASSISFSTPDEYAQKIHTLKESYFSAKVKVQQQQNVLDSVEPSGTNMIAEETTGRMGAYVRALGKSLPK